MNNENIINQLEDLKYEISSMLFNRNYDDWYNSNTCMRFEEWVQGYRTEEAKGISDKFNEIIEQIKGR